MSDPWPYIAMGSSTGTLAAVWLAFRARTELRFARTMVAIQKHVIKDLHGRACALEKENMEWARREVKRLNRLKRAGDKGRATQALNRSAAA